MNKETLILVFSCLGIAQALFLCFYLLTLKKGNKTANILLALMILGLTIRIGKSILNVYLDLAPWQRNLGISGILMVGPSLLFYGKVLLAKTRTLDKSFYIQLLPFLGFVVFCYLIPNDWSSLAYGIYIAVFTHLALYIGLSAILLLRHKEKIQLQLLKWYRNLIVGVALICVFYIGHVMGLFPLYIGGALSFSFLIYTFSFLLLQRHDFSLEKYSGSHMDRAASKKLVQAVKSLFQSEKLFLDNTITLASIADKVGKSSRDVSRAINENEGKNFSEFVNHYRIAKAKKMLVASEYVNEKIATIAYDCGFGNVTSFNLAFKAETQLTPTQYRNQFALS
ncbi:helix-turn-helix transcriptional regulator [Aggregatimonas sangjinii]|uniref:Helix-turn-helix transcriptional regulator n=1 Tax=Aggregatimonas sangjinii TaxID=2583587 RepID=A0A5B7SW51_9FLAO|nr:AraC family transcriptional regulator [Aggregatimonas sangjinii]QCX01539.1 helix-turn-helix transcriptional regulator [Aggregatimonas sangjinii]